MRIIYRKTLKDFWERHADSRQSLQAWYADAKQADWKGPADIKNYYRNASFLSNNRIVFNIKLGSVEDKDIYIIFKIAFTTFGICGEKYTVFCKM